MPCSLRSLDHATIIAQLTVLLCLIFVLLFGSFVASLPPSEEGNACPCPASCCAWPAISRGSNVHLFLIPAWNKTKTTTFWFHQDSPSTRQYSPAFLVSCPVVGGLCIPVDISGPASWRPTLTWLVGPRASGLPAAAPPDYSFRKEKLCQKEKACAQDKFSPCTHRPFSVFALPCLSASSVFSLGFSAGSSPGMHPDIVPGKISGSDLGRRPPTLFFSPLALPDIIHLIAPVIVGL